MYDFRKENTIKRAGNFHWMRSACWTSVDITESLTPEASLRYNGRSINHQREKEKSLVCELDPEASD
jgi:hypothetical protein